MQLTSEDLASGMIPPSFTLPTALFSDIDADGLNSVDVKLTKFSTNPFAFSGQTLNRFL